MASRSSLLTALQSGKDLTATETEMLELLDKPGKDPLLKACVELSNNLKGSRAASASKSLLSRLEAAKEGRAKAVLTGWLEDAIAAPADANPLMRAVVYTIEQDVDGIDLLEAGDYAAAAKVFDQATTDAPTPWSRARAAELRRSIRPDGITMKTALACIALFLLAIFGGSLVQP